jgi:hypothetical protein
MKKLILALTISLFAVSSYASSLTICEGITGSDSTLTLAINGGKLIQLQIRNQGSLPHALMTNLISTNAHTSIYTIMGTIDQLHLDNSVLQQGPGEARIGSERFDCLAN